MEMLKLQTPKGVLIAFLVTIPLQSLNFIQIKEPIKWHFNCEHHIYNVCLAPLSLYTLGMVQLDDVINCSIKMCLQNLYVLLRLYRLSKCYILSYTS